ncbi:MAG: hypothetical protein GX021_07030 [Tissierellia bacterium]|nr:hypothetical protein [Tissierellia bacterium]
MTTSIEAILELAKELPEEELGKLITYIKFFEEKDEPVLVLEVDDEEDIINILKVDEWYDSEEIEKVLEKIIEKPSYLR